ncbi:unnamed protein product, partial [Pylaiella littoralis]
RQQEQHKGEGDGGDSVGVEGGEATGGAVAAAAAAAAAAEGKIEEDTWGGEVGAGGEKEQDANDNGGAGSHRGHDPGEISARRSSNAAAAQSEGEEQGSATAKTQGVVNVAQSLRGEFVPPLSPRQQQQQQQQQKQHQYASLTTGTRGGEGGSAGGTAGGASRGASSRTPSAPLAPTWPAYCDPTYRMPGELTVRVRVDGEVKEMAIKVERFQGGKVFLGGYRNRSTGRVFHHASTQFGQRERPIKKTDHLRHRDTQTCKIKTTTAQTTNECGTQQMARKDMHLDNGGDTFKTAGEYQTAGQYWRVRERKTVTIQRFWRGFSARSRVWSRREEKWVQEEKEMDVVAEEERKKTQEREREMQRRMNPCTVQDFEILYNELDQWRDMETKRIKQAEVGDRRKLALRELLHKETRLLQTIDRLKITAGQEGKERRTRHMLELMSSPKQWEMGDGEVSEINTPWTNRARELQDLYEALEAPLLSVEERLDVLLHLKWTVGEFDCRLTRDIAELVDREADLLSRGRGEASLRPLRQRIRNLFLRFAETPDFNPEATRFVRVPPKYGKLTEKGMATFTSVGVV